TAHGGRGKPAPGGTKQTGPPPGGIRGGIGWGSGAGKCPRRPSAVTAAAAAVKYGPANRIADPNATTAGGSPASRNLRTSSVSGLASLPSYKGKPVSRTCGGPSGAGRPDPPGERPIPRSGGGAPLGRRLLPGGGPSLAA